ncbi:hypothetical protein [Candidatus Rhabdochlamydia porcellionis]|jgi:hypothetical protein|uniref:Uncharacterized protein n=1 Tax=Candidatus Rhabdochlamydia porcellionis TaxID=225148 RepID=A0ABX8YYJ7_9BACT|nr:hypothetical protein [Candidatus Rhabdochlamydia porcellionis]QZA58302.1 hypothetical protein RHAB15C_0000174 [Candidatus Rhabdochlamydia porcellionis]
MTFYVQSAFDSLIITPVKYVFDTLNGAYENTPLKKVCEVSSRFFKSLLKKPRDLAKGIEALGKCALLVLENKRFGQEVSVIVKEAGKCKGWLTLVGLSDQMSNALNLRSSNVVSFKNGDQLILEAGVHVLREGDTLRLRERAPILEPDTEFQLQNGALVKQGEQFQNGDTNRFLSEGEMELHLGNGDVFLLPKEARFRLGNLHSSREENRGGSLKEIFKKASFRKSLSAWAGVYSSAFESIKFCEITKIVSAQNPFLQIGNLTAIITGALARLGDDHKRYQTKGLGFENLASIAGNVSVFMLGAIPLANKKGLCRVSPKVMLFCSTIATLANLSSHFFKSMTPKYEDVNTLLLK